MILVLIMFVAGCTGIYPDSPSPVNSPELITPITPPEGSVMVFNDSDNGMTYAIPRNVKFRINLSETFATGTKWHAALSPGLMLLDDTYTANPESIRFDIDGTRSWSIQAGGTGQQSFHADFYPLDDKEKIQKSYTLSFQINK
jgi:inhibitor of cysteine peptidase